MKISPNPDFSHPTPPKLGHGRFLPEGTEDAGRFLAKCDQVRFVRHTSAAWLRFKKAHKQFPFVVSPWVRAVNIQNCAGLSCLLYTTMRTLRSLRPTGDAVKQAVNPVVFPLPRTKKCPQTRVGVGGNLSWLWCRLDILPVCQPIITASRAAPVRFLFSRPRQFRRLAGPALRRQSPAFPGTL